MQLVKEELQVKNSKGINVLQEAALNLNMFFIEGIGLKDSHKLKLIPIKKNFGWCDDVRSKSYNKFIKLPFKYNAEELYLKDSIYDIIVVIDYNLKPIKKNKGSAIFTYRKKKKNYSPTLGCVAISKRNLIKLLSIINKNTFLKFFL